MNADAELLNFIYQNSQMGVDTLNQLLPMIKEDNFRVHVQKELRDYQDLQLRAQDMLNDQGCDEKGLSAVDKIRTYLMLNMQTMSDHSPQHIAQMLVNGSSMGITDCIKNIRKYENDAKKESIALMESLQKFEENNVERLKAFL